MLNYIKCCFARRQEMTTGFTSKTKEYIYMNAQILCANLEAEEPVKVSTLILQISAIAHSL